jgi:MoaA/NifB/PqqE/SkfB family radical SAM enzyme
MDLALTYRCNNNCAHCYNARPRQQPELSTGSGKHILDRLWEIGIPHIVFTGGEPTLRPDLPELIAMPKSNGQITGINTNGRRLKDPALCSAGRRRAGPRADHARIARPGHPRPMVRAAGAWEDTVAGLRNALATRCM